MIQNLLNSYRAIGEIDLEENAVKMMENCNLAELLACLISQLEQGREVERSEGQMIADAMMVSKGITLLLKTATFNGYIRE